MLGGASVVVLVPVRGVCAVEGLYFLRDFLYFLVDFSFVQFEEAEVGGLCSFNIFSSCWF